MRHLGRAPVEEGGLGFPAEVGAGVVGGEVQGGLVVVGRKDSGAACQGHDSGQPDAAAELDGARSGEVPSVEVARQGDGARPQLRPVREPLVAVEVALVDQGVRGGGMRYAVATVPDTYDGFGQGGKAVEVRLESIQGSSAAGGGRLAGGAGLALEFGELGDAVAPEDAFEGLAGLVPDPAGGAERGVGDVADPARRATGRTDLAVQDLHDVQHRDLLRRHGEAVAPVRPAAALHYVRAPELAKDLLQEPLGDALAAGDLRHAERTLAFVERELHQRPNR